MGKKRRDKWRGLLYYLIIAAFILAAGAIGEFLYNLPVEKEEKYQYLTESQIEMDGFTRQEEAYVSTRGGASLKLTFPKQYVDKLYYEYQYEDQLHATIYAGKFTEQDSAKNRKIKDNNNHLFEASTVNIRQRIDEIIIEMPKEAKNVTIQAVAINNTGHVSPGRFAFNCLVAALVLLVLSIFHNNRFWKPERIFLAIASSVGLLMICTLPPHKVGLDEEIHFGRAYYLFETIAADDTVTVTPMMNDLITTSINNWPESIPQSAEEQREEKKFWNQQLKWDSQKSVKEDSKLAKYQQNNYKLKLYSFSYLPQALMIKVGQLLHLEFTMIYRLGRLGNLILYCIVVFFAIRKIPYGKRIMLTLALMPTALFSAVTYTYDTTVTAFMFLGIAYLLPELQNDGGKLSIKNALIFLLSFVIASLPKPVYIPLLLLALFIPASRFSGKKQCWLFRSGLTLVFLLVMATFALEPLLNANQAGDARGGDTSVGRQLRYIFRHPLVYAELLLSSLQEKFFSFTFGYPALGQMGHLPGNTAMVSTAMLTAGVVLTDTRPDSGTGLNRLQRTAVLILGFGTLCMVWTALYLSFTPVGADIIRGVQGRYYLPVTMMMLLACRIPLIKNEIPKRIDWSLLTAFSGALLLHSVYVSVVMCVF